MIFISVWLILINWSRADGNWMWIEVRAIQSRWLSGLLMNVYCVLRLCGKTQTRGQWSVGNNSLTAFIPLPVFPQPFLRRGCSRPGPGRRAPRLYTTTAPPTRTRTTASTTPRWTGGSSRATPGTWSQLSGQLRSTTPQTFGVCVSRRTDESNWVTVLIHE